MAKERGLLTGALNPVQSLALRIWLQKKREEQQEWKDQLLQVAMISNDTERWLPIFHPAINEPQEVDVNDFLDEDGVPNFDGQTIKYSTVPTAEDAQRIFESILEDSTGILRAEDTMR